MESPGGRQKNNRNNRGTKVKMMRPQGDEPTPELNERSQTVIDEAVQQVVGTMHNIKSDGTSLNVPMGTTPTREVTLDSAPVTASLILVHQSALCPWSST